MLAAALQTEVAPPITHRDLVRDLDLVDPTLILWRRPERCALQPLLRYYERAEAAGAIDSALVLMIVEVGQRRIADLLPPAPKRLIAARSAFVAELRRLIGLFAGVAETMVVRVKLEIERDDRCRYFHTDRVGLRLLCTYLGPGTEWVPDDFVERAALGRGDNAAIVPDPHRIERLAPFWVGLFKGNLHPDCPGGGCVHRSPPIGHRRNTARILLTIDNPRED
jgi:Protein of unknown function (DUF1826)